MRGVEESGGVLGKGGGQGVTYLLQRETTQGTMNPLQPPCFPLNVDPAHGLRVLAHVFSV